MRLDLVTEKNQIAEVQWAEKDRYGCSGVTVLSGEQYKIKLTKTRFGGGISIYPTRQITLDEFNKAKGTKDPVVLPDALLPFVGSRFTVDGAQGGVLRNQIQGIELLDEVPEGGTGAAFREALYRKLGRDETIGIFGALGFHYTTADFEDWDALVKQRNAQREAEKKAKE